MQTIVCSQIDQKKDIIKKKHQKLVNIKSVMFFLDKTEQYVSLGTKQKQLY